MAGTGWSSGGKKDSMAHQQEPCAVCLEILPSLLVSLPSDRVLALPWGQVFSLDMMGPAGHFLDSLWEG